MKTVFCIYLISGRVVKAGIPDNRHNNADRKENYSGNKNTVIALAPFLAKLALAVVCITLMILSAHRDEEINNALHCVAYADKTSLTADIHHTGSKKEYHSGNGKSIG